MKQYKYGTYGAIAKRDLKDMEFLLKKKENILFSSFEYTSFY